jgi:hypothetical protein
VEFFENICKLRTDTLIFQHPELKKYVLVQINKGFWPSGGMADAGDLKSPAR